MRLFLISLLAMGCVSEAPSEDEAAGLTDDVEPPDEDDDTSEGSVLNDDPISELSAGVNELTLDQIVAGQTVERQFFVVTPDTFDGTGSTPLLFDFHGNGGSADATASRPIPPVVAGDAIYVIPQGLERSWNLGPEDSEADDVAFVEAILGMLSETPGVDPTKPVAVGFSNGGGMIHEIAMESQSFTAIAPVISHLLTSKTPTATAAPVSVLQFSGTEDTLVPYDGGSGVLGHDFLPAEDSTEQWAIHNGCDATPTTGPTIPGPDVPTGPGTFGPSSYTVIEWENCDAGTRVVHVRMSGVGHELPPDLIEMGTFAYLYGFLLDARQ